MTLVLVLRDGLEWKAHASFRGPTASERASKYVEAFKTDREKKLLDTTKHTCQNITSRGFELSLPFAPGRCEGCTAESHLFDILQAQIDGLTTSLAELEAGKVDRPASSRSYP